MYVKVEAAQPADDVSTNVNKGTYVYWGSLGFSQGMYHWHWAPGSIRDVDTFWGFIRDDLSRELQTEEDRRRGGDRFWRSAEGRAQLLGADLHLWADRPKSRFAMVLFGFNLEVLSTGYGSLIRGNTVHWLKLAGQFTPYKSLEKT